MGVVYFTIRLLISAGHFPAEGPTRWGFWRSWTEKVSMKEKGYKLGAKLTCAAFIDAGKEVQDK